MNLKTFLQTNCLKRAIQNSLKRIYLSIKYYSFSGKKGDMMMIYKADGRLRHGGLADRFIGIITSYALSKIQHQPFKIDYTSPFTLSDYLEPNLYDWTVQPDELSYSRLHTNVAVHYDDMNWPKSFKIRQQIHLYTNNPPLERINLLFNTDYTYQELFNELFKQTSILKEKIDAVKKEIRKPYIGIQFRFVQLLGDFKDVKYQTLSSQKQEGLIQRCINVIQKIQSQYADYKIFLSSDSQKFINATHAMQGIFSIEGEILHIDYTNLAESNHYEKTFLDFFVLGGSTAIFNITGKGMIPSGFSKLSAQIHNVPFKRLDISSYL